MKRTGLMILTMSILLIIFLPCAAIGGAVENPNYFTLKAGIYSPESDDLEDFDTGFNGEFSFGRYLHRNFALELGVGYLATEASFTGFDPIFGFVGEEDQIRAIPVTLTAKGIYPIKTVELFAMAGVGLYFAHGESDLTIGPFGFSFDDDDIAFGFHVGGGFNFNVTKNLFFGIEGKYLWAEAEFEDSFLGIPVELEAYLDGYTVTANIGLRF